jgi:hydroxymethylpyrimidine pyrophosphatase-like HAD family hydrolase
MERTYTIFLDIDGTLIEHRGKVDEQLSIENTLDGTLEKLRDWDRKGYNIILVTGRRESTRKKTEKQLENLNIFYDKLIMGIGGGKRFLINDKKPDMSDTAFSINLVRNTGIKNLDI